MTGRTEKKITSFRQAADGFFLDLADAPYAVRVTPNDGTVVLHEGKGEDRLSHAAVPGDAVYGFRLDPNDGSASLTLTFRRKDQIDQHTIGVSDDSHAAQIWVNAVNRLYLGNRTQVVRDLLNTLENGPSANYRAEAARRLALLQAREAVALLTRLLESTANAWLRAGSARALGTLRITAATTALRNLLVHDPKPPVRAAAASALGYLHATEAKDALIDRLEHDPSTEVRGEAASALARIGGGVLVHLLSRARTDSKAWVRRQSVHAMGLVESEDAVSALTEKANDKEEQRWVVEAAAEALREIQAK